MSEEMCPCCKDDVIIDSLVMRITALQHQNQRLIDENERLEYKQQELCEYIADYDSDYVAENGSGMPPIVNYAIEIVNRLRKSDKAFLDELEKMEDEVLS